MSLLFSLTCHIEIVIFISKWRLQRTNNFQLLTVHTGWRLFFSSATECRVLSFLKNAIKSGTVARLTSGHDANCVSHLETRRHAACRRRVRLRTVRRDSRRIYRLSGRGRGKRKEASSPSFGRTGRADSCAGVTHASTPPAYVIKALRVSSRFLLCAHHAARRAGKTDDPKLGIKDRLES